MTDATKPPDPWGDILAIVRKYGTPEEAKDCVRAYRLHLANQGALKSDSFDGLRAQLVEAISSPASLDHDALPRMIFRAAIEAIDDGPEVRIKGDGTDIFVLADNVPIAKRGRPGTPHAKTWISLEPGWAVTDLGNDKIEVTHNGVQVH